MKKKNIFSLCIFLLFLTGCGAFSGSSNTIQAPEVHKGSEGLSIQFMQNAPPQSVYEETNFPLLLTLQNKGATDITEGWFTIGVEQSNMELRGEAVQSFSLLGRTASDNYGEQKIVELRGHTKKLPINTQRLESVLSVTACYAYSTDASADVCIDTDLYGLAKYQKACQMRNIAMSGGQGAPVGVSKVDIEIVPGEEQNTVIPQFTIYLENMGTGQTLVPEAVATACSSRSIKSEQYNIMKVEASLFEYELDCNPKLKEVLNDPTLQQGNEKAGYKKLMQKKGSVTCTLQEGISKARGTYTSPLMVHLEYGYADTISKRIEIKKK